MNDFQLAMSKFTSSNFDAALELIDGFEKEVINSAFCLEENPVVSPIYSIVVVNYRSVKRFTEMLKGLKSYELKVGFEIIVVNNANPLCKQVVFAQLNHFTLIELPFNYGCSGARNVGAHFSRGKYCIFVDDDGVIGSDSLEYLIETVEKHDAISCRGKVIPKEKNHIGSPHYDKGSQLAYSIPDAEGISIWKKNIFLRFGGFCSLLAGHEGMNLCAKMFPFFGRNGFIYDPRATLYHNFSDSKEALQNKKAAYNLNFDFLDYLAIDWRSLVSHFRISDEENYKSMADLLPPQCEPVDSHEKKSLSVLTFGALLEKHFENYIHSLELQTNQTFEIIVVNSNADELLEEKLRNTLFYQQGRLRLLRALGCSRSQCFEMAINQAENDFCVVHDFDDISINIRLQSISNYFYKNPQASLVSFCTFNEKQKFYAEVLIPSFECSLKARAFYCVPACFPTIGFRRSKMTEIINHDIGFGFECDWLYQNILKDYFVGHMFPAPLVYFSLPKRAQYKSRRLEIRQIAIRSLIHYHKSFIGQLNPEHKKDIWLLSGWRSVKTHVEMQRVMNYLQVLLSHVPEKEITFFLKMLQLYSKFIKNRISRD